MNVHALVNAGTPYCWAVDEYSPSAFVFHCDFSNGQKCGTVEARYVPQSMKLPMAGYKVTKRTAQSKP
eukprot:9221709-Pyramimonas_sp.AAC.2